MSAPARGDLAGGALLAAGRETDVQAPSIAPAARSRDAIRMPVWPRHVPAFKQEHDGFGRIVDQSFLAVFRLADGLPGKGLATQGIMHTHQERVAARADPAAGDFGMANADGRAATAAGDDHGSMASLVSLVWSEGIRRRGLIQCNN